MKQPYRARTRRFSPKPSLQVESARFPSHPLRAIALSKPFGGNRSVPFLMWLDETHAAVARYADQFYILSAPLLKNQFQKDDRVWVNLNEVVAFKVELSGKETKVERSAK